MCRFSGRHPRAASPALSGAAREQQTRQVQHQEPWAELEMLLSVLPAVDVRVTSVGLRVIIQREDARADRVWGRARVLHFPAQPSPTPREITPRGTDRGRKQTFVPQLTD